MKVGVYSSNVLDEHQSNYLYYSHVGVYHNFYNL